MEGLARRAGQSRFARTLKLAAPTAVEIARTRIRVGASRLAVADGNVRLAEFVWDDGKITTSGSFTAVPLVTVARIARHYAAVSLHASRSAAIGRSPRRRAFPAR